MDLIPYIYNLINPIQVGKILSGRKKKNKKIKNKSVISQNQFFWFPNYLLFHLHLATILVMISLIHPFFPHREFYFTNYTTFSHSFRAKNYPDNKPGPTLNLPSCINVIQKRDSLKFSLQELEHMKSYEITSANYELTIELANFLESSRAIHFVNKKMKHQSTRLK